MIPSPYLSSIAATFFFFFNFICLINSLSDDKYQSACQASFSSKKEVNKFWPFFFFPPFSLSCRGTKQFLQLVPRSCVVCTNENIANASGDGKSVFWGVLFSKQTHRSICFGCISLYFSPVLRRECGLEGQGE